MTSKLLLKACFNLFLLSMHIKVLDCKEPYSEDNKITVLNLDLLPRLPRTNHDQVYIYEDYAEKNDVEIKKKKNNKASSLRSTHFPCGCNMEYRLRDLGTMYFPRYMPTVVCGAGGCWGTNECRQRFYKVRVLKKKGLDEQDQVVDSNLNPLPAILRDAWIGVTITVTVSCECRP